MIYEDLQLITQVKEAHLSKKKHWKVKVFPHGTASLEDLSDRETEGVDFAILSFVVLTEDLVVAKQVG